MSIKTDDRGLSESIEAYVRPHASSSMSDMLTMHCLLLKDKHFDEIIHRRQRDYCL